MTCPGCARLFSEDLKREFAERYEFVFKESRSITALLMSADCANAGMDVETFRSVGFCPVDRVLDYGYYKIREWWVVVNGQLEKWSVGPGGFFRDRASQCRGLDSVEA